MINQNNYEIWLVDYLDGALSDAEAVAVEAFLVSHPEIAEELEQLKEISLSPSTATFSKKNELKKEIVSVGTITENNFETAFIEKIENQLSDQKQAELSSFLAKNPHLQNDLSLFEKTILSPSSASFSSKNQLKKKEKTRIIPLWIHLKSTQWSAAAAIVVLLIAGFYASHFTENGNSSAPLANTEKTGKTDRTDTQAKSNKATTHSATKVQETSKPAELYAQVTAENAPENENRPISVSTTQTVSVSALQMPQKEAYLSVTKTAHELAQINEKPRTKQKIEPVSAMPKTEKYLTIKEFLVEKLKEEVPLLQTEEVNSTYASAKGKELLQSAKLPVNYEQKKSGWLFSLAGLTISRN